MHIIDSTFFVLEKNMNLSDLSVSELRTLQAKISQEIKRRQDDELLEAKKKIQALS